LEDQVPHHGRTLGQQDRVHPVDACGASLLDR
jgi:hypothetical protein